MRDMLYGVLRNVLDHGVHVRMPRDVLRMRKWLTSRNAMTCTNHGIAVSRRIRTYRAMHQGCFSRCILVSYVFMMAVSKLACAVGPRAAVASPIAAAYHRDTPLHKVERQKYKLGMDSLALSLSLNIL